MKKLLLFQTTRAVIRAERILQKEGFKLRVIPVPKDISSECGIAIELSEEDCAKVVSILQESGIVAQEHGENPGDC